MEYKEYELEKIINCCDKKRKPLSTMQRKKMQGKYPYYGAQEIIDYINDYIFDGKYILLAEDGENLRSRIKPLLKIVNDKFWLNNHAHIFTCKEGFSLEYIYYVLLNFDFQPYITGTSQPKLNQDNMMKIKIKVPKLEIQIKIASILERLDKKMELNNQINDNLLELSSMMFKKYFEDGSNYKEKEQRLGEICNIKYGKGLTSTKILNKGYPVYGGNGIVGYYNEKMYDESQILISCRGAASGKVIVTKPNSFVTNNSLILESDRKYYFYLKEKSLANPYYMYTTGSAQPQITIDSIKDILIPIPQDEVLNKYNRICEIIEKKYFETVEEIEKLEQLRDTLLPKLMNGEIDLEKVEI